MEGTRWGLTLLLCCIVADAILVDPHPPANVTYDERSLLVDGKRLLFLSGGMVSCKLHVLLCIHIKLMCVFFSIMLVTNQLCGDPSWSRHGTGA